MNINKKKEIKEEFCPVCLIAPLAFSGVGTAAYGETHSNKKSLFYVGIVITIISILIGLYYLYRNNNKDCSECSL